MKKAVAILVSDLVDGNFEAVRAAGLQPMTQDEIAQMAADANASDEYQRLNGYKEARRDAYPAITDQLDAIMKWAATQKDLPDSLKEIAAQCMAVKEKFPKPQ